MRSDKKFDLWALLACLGLALAFRLPGLTVFLTADEARSWFGRSIIFLDSLARGDWANTGPGGQVPFIENVSLSPAPGVTTMWAGAVGIILEYLRQGAPGSVSQFLRDIPFDPLDPATLFSLRLPGVLIAVAAVGLTYWWSRPLLGRWGAFLAAGLLALDPFSLALSRVLGHDGLVSIFMWLSLLAFLRAMMSQRMANGLPPGAAATGGEWRTRHLPSSTSGVYLPSSIFL
ncbi:MAG TPA: glycosyltransferase family 39 protein, partial [Anaerolineae bacterium]|nr:glycosyltransferase family 39 protein [Anaerolineae bacterium]